MRRRTEAVGHWLLALLLVICSLLLQGEAVRSGGEAVRGGGEAVRGGGEAVRGGGEAVRGGGEAVWGGGEAVRGGGEARPPCEEATSLTFQISTGFVLTASDHILLTQVKRTHPVGLLILSVSDPDSNGSAVPDSRQAKLVPQKQEKEEISCLKSSLLVWRLF
jgi:hypothetical protein